MEDAATPERPDARQVTVRSLAQAHHDERGALLPVLHDVLDTFGFVDPDDVPVIADVLNLSRAEVHGVLTFYTDFRTTPPPGHRVTICRAEACHAVGGQGVYAAVRDRFAAAHDVEVGEVFCLGNCALGPSGTVDGRLHGRLTPERVEALAQEWDR